MKKLIIVGAGIGLLLGIAQLFYVRTVITKYADKINSSATCTALTAACGYCPEGAPVSNGYCYSRGQIQKYRGLPFSPKSGYNEKKSTKITLLYANVAIFVILVPLLLVLIVKLIGTPVRRRRAARRKAPATSTESLEKPGPEVE